MIQARRRLLMQNLGKRLGLVYGSGLQRYPTSEDATDPSRFRCATVAINVKTGDVLTIEVPDGFAAALGVWYKEATMSGGLHDNELYGSWNANLSYTVLHDNMFARYAFKTVPTEKQFSGGELDGLVRIRVNDTLYFT